MAGNVETKVGKTNFIAEPGKQEIVITRLFDAPRERLFKVMMDPALIPQWWGPRGHTTIVDKMEVRPGGIWRFIGRDPSGAEFAFHGVYHSISAPGRVVDTFEFEGVPGHVLLETHTLEDQGGKTLLTSHIVYESVADRDGMVASRMEWGQNESMERLTELLAKA
jgi:uncharacterized protein YndB with AHSA1/START domain